MKTIYKFIPFLFILFGGFITGCSDDDDNKRNVEAIKILETVEDTIFIDKYDTHQVKIETTPKNQTANYFSTNASVFTVNDEGIITANEGGVGFLHVVAPNATGWTRATCVIDVTSYVESIEVIDKSLVILAIDGTLNVSSRFKALPESAKTKTLAYKSSNPAVATVDEKGVVTSITKGIVEITALSTDGKYNVESDPITVYSGYSRNQLSKSGWTATASSQYSSSFTASKIIDGSTGTNWICGSGIQPPHWVLIDMRAVRDFHNIIMTKGSYAYFKGFKIYISDEDVDNLDVEDPSFTLLIDDAITSASTYQWNSFPETVNSARYIKIYLDNMTQVYAGIAEIDLYLVN